MATPSNNLPKEITLTPSVNKFKNRLDSYLGTTTNTVTNLCESTLLGK